MHILAVIVAVFSLAAVGVWEISKDSIVLLLAGVGFICAYTTYRSAAISSFLKIFAAIFATETVVFGAFYLLSKAGLWPAAWEDYLLPESLPLTVAMFAILVYALSFVPVVRTMMRIADRYFTANEPTTARIWPFPSFNIGERPLAKAMVVFLVVINQAQVGMEVRLSFFSRDWFNAIQSKNEKEFWLQLLTVFLPWAFLFIASAVIEFVVQSTLIIRWRRWLTDHYVDRWLGNHTHYRMSLLGATADNPDQRISEDVNRFIEGGQVGYGIYSFTILLIAKLSSLVSFAIILWTLSANFTMPGTNIAVPGFLFWVALIYAGVGTLFTHLIGRPLVNLSFMRQRYEANFRFSLARLREYSEQVALLSGERAEQQSLRQRFTSIITNYYQIVATRKRLTAFTASYGQVSPFIPYIVAAPFYFADKITLGIMTQTARAFGSVNDALTFFVTYYVSLADFKAVLDRLSSFDAAIEKAQGLASIPRRSPAQSKDVAVEDLTLRLPDGRAIMSGADLRLTAQTRSLLTGQSGSGKSTLFRAISGIWPYGGGSIDVPPEARVMLLPQKPYIPNGTLRAAVTYPSEPDQFSDVAIRAALTDSHLPGLAEQLDAEDNWGQRLSGGEQQRLAIARVLLAKPDWLFLDEATASMDDKMEAAIYRMLSEKLPATTIISIGHHTALGQFHERHLTMRKEGEVFVPRDMPRAAE